MPAREDKENSIQKSFFYFDELPNAVLCGVRVVNLFAQEEENASTAVALLTRFYDGENIVNLREEASLRNLQRNLPRFHYLGICKKISDCNLLHFSRWESYGFLPLFVGFLEDGGFIINESAMFVVMVKWLNVFEDEVISLNQKCSMNNLTQISKRILLRLLPMMQNFSPAYALRIFRGFGEHGAEHCRRLWSKIDDGLVSGFIAHPRNDELITHLIPEVGEAYFGGELPIALTEMEQLVLLRLGLQRGTLHRIGDELQISIPEARGALQAVFMKALDLFNNSPEVVDP